MSEQEQPLSKAVVIDDERDVVEIYGIKYSGSLFRGLGFERHLPSDQYFRVVKRDDDLLTIEAYPQPSIRETEEETTA